MESRTKKPLFDSYKLVMIPHILPHEAKARGVSCKNKAKWKELVKIVRSNVKRRYDTASPDDLWSDMKFKRYDGTHPKTRFKKTIEVHEDIASVKKEGRLQSYLQNKEVIDSLQYVNPSTRDWIDCRRTEKLCKISKYEMTFTERLGQNGVKSILKMPFVVDNRIYFSDVYIPKFRLAIEIVPINNRYNDERSIYKTEDLESIGIKRIVLYNYEAAHPDIAMKIMQKYGKK